MLLFRRMDLLNISSPVAEYPEYTWFSLTATVFPKGKIPAGVAVLLFGLLVGMASVALGQQNDKIPELKTQLESLDADSQKVDLMIDIGQKVIERGEIDTARLYFSRAFQLADSLDFTFGRQKALYGFGDFYLVQQKFDSAETVLKRAMELNPNPPLLHRVRNLLATSYRYQGNNQRAIELYRETIAEVDTTENARLAAGLSQNLADAHMNVGNSAEAFRHYHKAILYGEEAQDSLFLATALNNLGNAYNDEEKFEEAGYYLERSLEICEAIDFKPGQLRATMNLGNTRSSQSRFEESESLYMQALALSEQVRPDTPPYQIQYNLGELYNRMDNLDEAENYFRKSLENSKEANVLQGTYYNSTGLGNLAEAREEITEAIEWYSGALESAQTMNNPSMQQEAHKKLAALYKKNDYFEQALHHLESYNSLTDSLQTEKREQMLAEYQTRLEVERKNQMNRTLQAERDRQQARLRFQYWLLCIGLFVILVVAVFAGLLFKSNREKKKINRALEAQKEELRDANELQNKLFGMVAHDLRTPMSALVGMLQLVRSRSLSEEELRSLISELELSMQQNLNIMENLLTWTKQQMSGQSVELEVLDVNKIADEIIEAHKFNAEHKQLTLENNISDSLEVKGDQNMLKLVLRNLVSNSIKFSEEGDQIVIDGTPQNGEVLFEIRDTGIGIPEDIQSEIFGGRQTRRGTRQESGSGMGLNLCKEFIEKQGGNIYFESTEGEGTSFYFALPVANN